MPTHEPLIGAGCRLEPLDADRHCEALYGAYAGDPDARHWTYLPYGPFENLRLYREWVLSMEAREDVVAFAILEGATRMPLGVACYLRVDPPNGSIEVGHIRFSSQLQRTSLSTEAMYLMMKRVFDDWGYRRYEWKCDALNGPSRAAALRLGFRYEGTFRNAVVMKGRNRDTAWFSILDSEWPVLRRAFEGWLASTNFDSTGEQRRRLADFQKDFRRE